MAKPKPSSTRLLFLYQFYELRHLKMQTGFGFVGCGYVAWFGQYTGRDCISSFAFWLYPANTLVLGSWVGGCCGGRGECRQTNKKKNKQTNKRWPVLCIYRDIYYIIYGWVHGSGVKTKPNQTKPNQTVACFVLCIYLFICLFEQR